MATNNSNYTYDDLVKLNDERAITLIPAMLVLSLYMLIGLIGNSLVCYIMGCRSQLNNQNFLIIWLAIFDLLNCLLAIPTDILRVRYSYTFPSEAACKILRVILGFTILGSTFVLTIIGIDRYKRICKPLTTQISRRKLKKMLAFVTVLAFALSCPAAVIFGIASFDSPLPGLKAHYCSNSDDLKDTIFPKLYTISLIMTFLVLSICLITVYSIINITVRRHAKRMQRKTDYDDLSPSSREDITKTIDSPVDNNQRKHTTDLNISRDNISFNYSVEDTPTSGNIVNTHIDVYAYRMQLTDDANSNHDNNVECDNSNRSQTKPYILALETEFKSVQNNLSSRASCSSMSTALTPASSMNTIDEPMTADNLKKSNSENRIFQVKKYGNENNKVVQETTFSNSNPSTKMSASNCNSIVSLKQTGHDKIRSANEKDTKEKKSTSEKMETKTTKIAFLVTLLFILSFLPHLTLRILENVYEGLDYNLQGAPLVFYSICFRSYYINSISNPIIYSVLNIRFRNELQYIFRKYCCNKLSKT